MLFNTDGTVLNEKNGRAMITAGLDELRVSLDAANARSYRAIRGKNYFDRILRNVRTFKELQVPRETRDAARLGLADWAEGDAVELPDFVRVAAGFGVSTLR